MEPRLFGLIAAFVVLAFVFLALERAFPGIRGQKLLRAGYGTDLVYWLFTPLATKLIAKAALIATLVPVAYLLGVHLQRGGYTGYGPLSRQPLWLQTIELFVAGDFIGYWTHRWFHGKTLWRFHAVHHSSTALDWLSSVRLHPVNDIVTRVIQVIPFVLGLSPVALVAYVPFLTFYSILVHANLNWDFGPLRSAVATPVFHRWHHTRENEALDKNFAGFLPLWDILFGTYYMPKGKVPTEFGTVDAIPQGLLAQLAYPFQRVSSIRAENSVDEGARIS